MKPQAPLHPLLRPATEAGWRIEAAVRAVAGAIVLASLLLSLLDNRWLWLTAFVGANLLQSGLSGWCLMSNLLSLIFKRSPSSA
ncbi:MAG: DUF2892 domain-containing protein [Candidatus Velthaea sp.]|jgi:hypothetical protein